jgi:hypothetical protein
LFGYQTDYYSMPQKKNNNRKGNRKPKRSALLPMVTTPPRTKNILMTYSINGSLLESAAGVGASYFWRLNSVFDPDQSGVGTTATGYSTWSALFLNYKVMRTTVRIRTGISGATGGMAQVTFAPVPRQAVVPASPTLWRSIKGGVSTLLTPIAVVGRNLYVHQQTYDLARVACVTKSQYANDMDFSGAVGSNPAREMFFMLGVQGVGGSAAANCLYSIDITYCCEWFNNTPMQL